MTMEESVPGFTGSGKDRPNPIRERTMEANKVGDGFDALYESAQNSQRIAHKLGHSQMGVEVYGWAIKHAFEIPAPALKELMDLITGGPK